MSTGIATPDGDRAAYVERVDAELRNVAGAVTLPDEFRITLTARTSTIPVQLTNNSDQALTVRVELDSDQLEFPDGEVLTPTLPPGTTRLEVRVRARTSGAFTMDVTVSSPDGSIELDRRRSTSGPPRSRASVCSCRSAPGCSWRSGGPGTGAAPAGPAARRGPCRRHPRARPRAPRPGPGRGRPTTTGAVGGAICGTAAPPAAAAPSGPDPTPGAPGPTAGTKRRTAPGESRTGRPTWPVPEPQQHTPAPRVADASGRNRPRSCRACTRGASTRVAAHAGPHRHRLVRRPRRRRGRTSWGSRWCRCRSASAPTSTPTASTSRSSEFYDKLASSDDLPETAAPSPGAFEAAFRRQAEAGADAVVCINLSSGLSATIQAAQNAAKAVAGDLDVRVVDSPVDHRGPRHPGAPWPPRPRPTGPTPTTSWPLVETWSPARMCIGALDTLENLRKGGRIGGAQALLGSLLSIKPLLDISTGEVAEAGRARTRRKALEWLRDKVFGGPPWSTCASPTAWPPTSTRCSTCSHRATPRADPR